MTEHLGLAFLAALAGGVGAVLRFVVDGAITSRLAKKMVGDSFPWGVLVVNLSGSFAIGVLIGMLGADQPWSALLGTGLLGGYTTFSTASYDTVRLLRRGRVFAGLVHGLGQLVAAVLAASFGLWVGGV